MVERTFEKETEQFLTEYGASILSLNNKHPASEDSSARMRGFEKLHRQGMKRIKGLLAEFGEKVF